ncbi:MAG: helix-turn-helix domain-containing protein [Steroidobacteraceae bacterium]
MGFSGNDGADALLVWHDPVMRTGLAALFALICDALLWLRLTLRSTRAIQAENLFLRRQLSLYIERGIKPRRIDPVTRVRLTLLSKLFQWRDALVVVRPETPRGWHRSAWKLLWRVKSRPGRPAIPPQLQGVIRRMATENPRWGEERIANELLLKLGIQVSPRTVRKYMPRVLLASQEGICTGPPSCACTPRASWPVISASPSRRVSACSTYSS